MKFWAASDSEESKGVEANSQANSYDVEMTSYGLMTYVMRNDIEGAISIMKWLIAQLNSNGGFASTQVWN